MTHVNLKALSGIKGVGSLELGATHCSPNGEWTELMEVAVEHETKIETYVLAVGPRGRLELGRLDDQGAFIPR